MTKCQWILQQILFHMLLHLNPNHHTLRRCLLFHRRNCHSEWNHKRLLLSLRRYLIDLNLLRGNPVIVRLKAPSGKNHFVVVVGKDGFDYLIADPGAGFDRGVYPLKELTSRIEALRFYQELSG